MEQAFPLPRWMDFVQQPKFSISAECEEAKQDFEFNSLDPAHGHFFFGHGLQ